MSEWAWLPPWISAGATVVIGGATFSFAIYQWIVNRFKPNVTAVMETSRERVAVSIANERRGAGMVMGVHVVRSTPDHPIVESALVADGSMTALPYTILNPGALMIVALKASERRGEAAPADGKWAFPSGVQVLVQTSRGNKIVSPELNSNLSLETTKTQLPPTK